MRYAAMQLTAIWLLSVSTVAYSQEELPRPVYTPPIAVNGEVELTEVEVTRKAVGYAAPEVLLSDMRLGFWLPVSKEPVANASFAIRLLSLDAIEDNKGTPLLTEKRRDEIRELSGFRPSRAIISHFERQGPQFDFRLNIPSREATSLKRIKGTIEISQTGTEIISFDKFSDQLGKPLKHPNLVDFVITPISLKMEDGDVVCQLRLPKEHSLLQDWTLMRNREPLRGISIETKGAKGQNDTIDETRYFVGDSTDNLSLYIRFAVKTEPKKLNFDFRDIPLP